MGIAGLSGKSVAIHEIKNESVKITEEAPMQKPSVNCSTDGFADENIFSGLSSSFFDTGFFTGKLSEVVNSRSANFTSLVNFDLLKCRQVQWEDTLYSNCSTHFADGKGMRKSGPFDLDHNSTKGLGTGLSPFSNFIVNSNGISRCKFREI